MAEKVSADGISDSIEASELLECFYDDAHKMNDDELINVCERLLHSKEKAPAYADEISEAFADELGDNGYGRLSQMLCKYQDKQKTDILLDIWKTALKDDVDWDIATYDNLCKVAATRPELNSKIMDLIKIQPYGKSETQIQSDIKVKQELLKAKNMVVKSEETTQSIAGSVPFKPNGRGGNGGFSEGR